MAKLRGGLMGCGMISEYHLKGWQRIPEVEIVAIGNRTIEKAELRARQFAPQAKLFSDLSTMLKEVELDFIDILSPPFMHREHVLQAKDAGVHIICQKPLTDTLESTEELVKDFRDYPKLFAVHENHRYRPWFQTVMEQYRKGFFGKVSLFKLEQYEPVEPAEAYKVNMEPGVLLEYGTHLVDMVRALLGEPESVYARTHNLNPRVKGESLVHVVFEYPETTAIIDTGWKPVGVKQGSVLVQGDEGEAYFEGTMTRGESSRFRLIKGHETILDESRDPLEDYTSSFYLLERECVDAMLRNGSVIQTPAENLKTLRATFSAYEAARRGEVIKL
jgi:D-apiose dehydrogenase